MKLSEIFGWEKKPIEGMIANQLKNREFNSAIESCDREIDKEALDSALSQAKNVEDFISTIPTWLKRSYK